MATSKSNPAADAAAAFTPDLEAASARVRELNEKMIEAAKKSGNLSLDAYEKTLKGLVDFEEKAAGASQIDFVNALATAYASFVTEVSNAFTTAARDALK
ncbi:hypothetical protein [Flexivirga oryzae]|uniref:Exopolyphosphatase/pppGpp-phosphohydrolase n=1 Tax=Flexivirga oryzae TaxID=1794944 RepID=A0A839NCH9_9MICO|nr:hypothetical protein [Flexivirga oryzae]MBB2893654.1 exopolyphosphatase/pppGpp-phosphohydrolase [Flexivirga oryzae]